MKVCRALCSVRAVWWFFLQAQGSLPRRDRSWAATLPSYRIKFRLRYWKRSGALYSSSSHVPVASCARRWATRLPTTKPHSSRGEGRRAPTAEARTRGDASCFALGALWSSRCHLSRGRPAGAAPQLPSRQAKWWLKTAGPSRHLQSGCEKVLGGVTAERRTL